jgi:hypothetical protein
MLVFWIFVPFSAVSSVFSSSVRISNIKDKIPKTRINLATSLSLPYKREKVVLSEPIGLNSACKFVGELIGEFVNLQI